MTLRGSPTPRKRSSSTGTAEAGQDQTPLLSLRAIVLLVIAAGCGLLAVSHPAWAIGIGTTVVVLTLLDKIIGS